MTIPKFNKIQKGEYSLIQISPNTDSQELINIGVIVKNLETNCTEMKLFDDINKLTKRIYIENHNALKYAFNILEKQITKYNSTFKYENFTNSIKINKPLPIAITEDSLLEQTIKMYQEKVTLLKTFNTIITANNIQYDKNHIIDNINTFVRTKELGDIVKTRKHLITTLGSKKRVDTIIYNSEKKPIIVSDIISPVTSHIEEMYMKSLFTLKNLSDDTIKKCIFYIPAIDNLPHSIDSQIKYIKENIKKENLYVNDSKDQNEYIEQLVSEA